MDKITPDISYIYMKYLEIDSSVSFVVRKASIEDHTAYYIDIHTADSNKASNLQIKCCVLEYILGKGYSNAVKVNLVENMPIKAYTDANLSVYGTTAIISMENGTDGNRFVMRNYIEPI